MDAGYFLTDKEVMKYDLPIDAVLPQLVKQLSTYGRVVLQAPPGAGKTTRTPLAILQSGMCDGKILMLEPRRLAAIAAAERMAETLEEPIGATVGYRIRGQTRIGPNTRIEVLTEGILTRMLQSDPELPGVSAILFDEFHERSLNADLGLALSWEVRETLRSDLLLVVMSATLDAEPVARLLNDAPIVTSEGRSYPVEIIYLPRPQPKEASLEVGASELILKALKETGGDILVFLPGEHEINKTSMQLKNQLPKSCILRPLFGNLSYSSQKLAISPDPKKRKIILSTAIAETSLTIEGIHAVVDCGLSRRARYDPKKGLQTLVTERASKAEAIQRSGRAGRVAPGKCYRMWARVEEGVMPTFAPPEIHTSDLTPLALKLAQWGTQPKDLAFLTSPPQNSWAQAQDLLYQLGAITDGKLSSHGANLAELPLHPRFAQMLVKAGPTAAPLAALLSDRDILISREADLTPALQALSGKSSNPQIRNYEALKRIKIEANRLVKLAPEKSFFIKHTYAQCLALAYPERVAQRRPGTQPRYIMANGKGVVLANDDGLANASFLVISELGNPHPRSGTDPKIRRALPISLAEIREIFSPQIKWVESCHWSKRNHKVLSIRTETLGSIRLASENWAQVPIQAISVAMLDGIMQLGLNLPKSAQLLQARATLAASDQFPDISNEGLMRNLEHWLRPYISKISNAEEWKKFDPLPALQAYIGWANLNLLDTIAPTYFITPLGNKIIIDYSGDSPSITLRIQEMFGQTSHPLLGGHPIKIILLSPAHKPIQITNDIPGFWKGSYADVRKDMRAKYPKHPWPEDPTNADPTLRAKPRKK